MSGVICCGACRYGENECTDGNLYCFKRKDTFHCGDCCEWFEVKEPVKRKPIPKSKRTKVWEKTKRRCAYCGIKLKYPDMTVDHLVPVQHGGTDDFDNLLAACRSCNHRKSSSRLESFREQVEKFPAILKRDSVTYRNAERFGLVIPNPHKIKFYFETLGGDYNKQTTKGDIEN
jgi:5-methylcytosine-specific restriction endonuclease McrA